MVIKFLKDPLMIMTTRINLELLLDELHSCLIKHEKDTEIFKKEHEEICKLLFIFVPIY